MRLAHRAAPVVWFLSVVAGYALLGRLGLLLTLPGELASPLYPAAGFALAVALVHGARWLPAIAAGAFIANAWLNQGEDLLLPLLVAVGASAQAGLGAWLVRRRCQGAIALQTPQELGWFIGLGLGLAGLVSPTWATLCLGVTGHLAPDQWMVNWGTWWIGDSLGALIGAPFTLTWIGQPRTAWQPRRLTVGAPLLVATILVGWGAHSINGWSRQQAQAEFELQADQALGSMTESLRRSQRALEALQGVLRLKPTLSKGGFEAMASALLDEGSPALALGLAVQVSPLQVNALDREAQADGLPDFVTHDRRRSDDRRPTETEDLLVVRYVAPLARNAATLGENLFSIPAAREAAERALRTGQIVSSAPFALSQSRDPNPGVLLMQVVPDSGLTVRSRGDGGRPDVLVLALSPTQMLRWIAGPGSARWEACIADRTDASAPQRLAGRPGCERTAPTARLARHRQISVGGRSWTLTVHSVEQAAPEAAPGFGHSWPFALMGLCMTALGGALLLLVSGRTHQVEVEVQLRTAELRREIQERQLSEDALRESEERFRNLFESAPIGIVFTDFDGRYLEANPRFGAMLERPVSELLGQLSSDLTHPDDRDTDEALGRQLLRGEISMYRREKRFVRQDGTAARVRVWVSLLRSGEGRPSRFLAVVEDVTDELRAREAERVRSIAETANQAKNEFLSRMSHELRTPMNAILGFAQLMLLDAEEPLAPGQRSRIEQISAAGWHLLEMINDTLDLSRIDSGMLRVDLMAQHLPSLIARATSLVQGMASERSVRITTEFATGSATVWGDATRIIQVLTNLLSNAIKYNHRDGWVQLTVRHPDDHSVEIKVRDSGQGLSVEQRQHLFEPFNRLGQEQGNVPGTGIGLVISRRLAEMMGGTLSAADTPPPGACFVFTLRSASDKASNAAE